MVLRNVFIAIVCTMLLAWSGLSVADQYRPGELLGLDLPSAALSPKPLGPLSHFVPGPLDVSPDRGHAGAQAKAEPKIMSRKTHVAQTRVDKPRAAVRTRLARSHGNPLDAEAFDTRIQVWPCKSGGICNWKR